DSEYDGYLHFADANVPRHLPLAVSRAGVAQHDHRKRHEREAPHHAEGIQRAQEVDVTAAGHDGEDLQPDNQVDDAVAGAEALLRPLEPRRQNTVFYHAVQDAVGADDRGVQRSRKNQRADQYHEALEHQPHAVRTDDAHGQPADEVGEVSRPDA